MQWRFQKTVPIGTPLEVLQRPIKYSVHSLRASCELEFGTGVDAVNRLTRLQRGLIPLAMPPTARLGRLMGKTKAIPTTTDNVQSPSYCYMSQHMN